MSTPVPLQTKKPKDEVRGKWERRERKGGDEERGKTKTKKTKKDRKKGRKKERKKENTEIKRQKEKEM